MMKIRAAVARAPHAPMVIEELEIEEPRNSEILVRVVATGVCHTDMVARDGLVPTPRPVVLGHEGAGVVERVGRAVTKVVPGDHVVMTFDSCGYCPSCDERAPSYCHEFFLRNFFAMRGDNTTALRKGAERVHSHFFGQSSFATFAICNERNVVRVRDDVPLELLGPLACSVQTGAGAVINALQIEAGRSFAVFGAGAVGLSAVMAARASGAAIIVAVDTNEGRLDVARSLGATDVFNATVVTASHEILRITDYGVNYALDTTGFPSVIREATMSLAPRGVCGVLGASPLGSEIVLDEVHFMRGGRRLIGIVEGDSTPDVFIPTLIELYRKGRLPFDRLVRFYPLEQINEAIRDSETGRAIKPVLLMR